MQIHISDTELLDRLQNGKDYSGAFSLLIDKYQQKLYLHIKRLVTTHDDADDVLQNTFVKVHKSIKKFRGDSGLYTWIYRIATNESINLINKRKKKQLGSMTDEMLNQAKNSMVDDSVDSEYILKKLNEAIALLPEKQKIVFNLRYFDEMNYREMSEVLQTSEGALKASFHHAVKKIEAFIKNV